MIKYFLVLTLVVFQISTIFSQEECTACPTPQIEEVVNIGNGQFEVYWSIEESECLRRLRWRTTWRSCFGGGTSGPGSASLDENPIIVFIGNGSHGNKNGDVTIDLRATCNQFRCENVCEESNTSSVVEVLSTCDCDLYSAEYTCDQICFNIDEHDFSCVAYDVRLRNRTTNTTTEYTISSTGESSQLCVDRNPLHSYSIFTKVDADCDPETTQLTARCAFYKIMPCEVDTCGPLPDPSDLAYVCAPGGNGFNLEIAGPIPNYRACDNDNNSVNYLDASYAGTTIEIEICDWTGISDDCNEPGICCATYQVPVPEACPPDCPDFPTAEDVVFMCDNLTGGFNLSADGFRVCPSWLPPDAASTTVSLEVCAWEGGPGLFCEEDGGMCCDTIQVLVPEACPQDCPDFPTAEDVEIECLPNEGGITFAADGFRVCPGWLPSSVAGTTVSLELCAWEGGPGLLCEEDGGMCCDTIQVLVPECEDCIPNADCDDFSLFIAQEGSWSPATTYVSEVEANIGVVFNGGGRQDHLTIMVNGATVISAFAGNGFDEECTSPDSITTSFCVYPCDEVSINVEAATCPDQTSTSYWALTLACTHGCTAGRRSPDKPKGISIRPSDAAESNFLKPVELTVFPNPVTDILNIITSDPMIEYRTASVIHSSGKMIHTENISRIDNLQIDASAYPQGLYILELIDNNGNRVAKRFMKID